jgi:hypothetical protein
MNAPRGKMNALRRLRTSCGSGGRPAATLDELRKAMNALRRSMSDLCEHWTLRASVGRPAPLMPDDCGDLDLSHSVRKSG